MPAQSINHLHMYTIKGPNKYRASENYFKITNNCPGWESNPRLAKAPQCK